MQELFSSVDRWILEGKQIALAMVIKTWGSSPRGVGAKMAINAEGEMAGSVSGGCVEGAVVDAGLDVIRTGVPQLLHFGVTDENAWDVGLACGGEIEVFVQNLNVDIFKEIQWGWEKGIPSVVCVVIRGGSTYVGQEMLFQDGEIISRSFAHSHLNELTGLPKKAIENRESFRETITLLNSEEIEIFINVIQPPPVLIIVGGVHIAIPLVTFANTLGFKSIVIDPRRKFGSHTRFGHADQVINAWPQRAFSEISITPSTAIAILTHDPKIDDPALTIVLSSPAFYVGALGSKKTQSARQKRLLADGLTETQINRMKGPIGIDLGSRSSEEIALAIIAEIIKEKNRK